MKNAFLSIVITKAHEIFVQHNDHRSGLQKLQSPRYFTWSLRDIGKSFQLAITAPRLDLTGYGTTTAQGCPTTPLLDFYTLAYYL